MNKHLVIAAAVVVIGSMLAIGGRYFADATNNSQRDRASDAALIEDTLKLGMDSWVGYAPLCADEMARRLALRSLGVDCIDDGADYKSRFRKLRRGELDLAVTTLDAYLRNYASDGPIGPIVAVINESKGGDAIIARSDKVGSLEALKSGQKLSIAYTPESPSEFLMTAIGQHFGVPFDDRSRFTRIKTDGSGKALKALRKGQADIAVLWEPDVSTALSKDGFIQLMGSQDIEGLIVDVLVASPKIATKRRDELETLLNAYFTTQRFYSDHPERRNSDIASRFGLKKKAAATMVAGVKWADLLDNSLLWFSSDNTSFAASGEQRLLSSLYSTQSILARAGIVDKASLPASEVLRMISSAPIRSLMNSSSNAAGNNVPTNSSTAAFAELNDADWANLREVGALQVEPVAFQSGTALLTTDGRAELDKVAETLRYYPKFRVVVQGHTSTGGDSQANMSLSLARAESVRDYLRQAHSVHKNRLRAEGYGDRQPLPRLADESLRAYRYRLPRVEIRFLDNQSVR